MRTLILTISLVHCLVVLAVAQESNYAAQLQAITKLPDDTVKVRLLNELASELSQTDVAKALTTCDLSIALAKKLGFKPGIANGYYKRGLANYFSGQYVAALEDWKRAEGYFQETGDQQGVAAVLSNSGAIYYNIGDLNKALELYLKSLKIAEKIGDKHRIGTLQQNIGALHSDRDEHDKALKAYLSAEVIGEEIGDKEILGTAQMDLLPLIGQ